MDGSLPGSSVHGISQAKILEWVAFFFSRGSSHPRDWICISCLGRQILYCWATRESPMAPCVCVCVCVCISCSVVSDSCDPMDYSLPGSSVHGILQARILEWVATPFSRRSSWPRDWTQVPHTAGRFFTVWATSNPLTHHVLCCA